MTFAIGSGPNSTSFKKGSKPWNKGLKGWSPAGSEKGRFKKGQLSKQKLPVGTISIRTDKNGKQRRWIKVTTEGELKFHWIMYSTWLWEKENGSMPAGLFVHHLDGNSMNDSLNNYSLVNRSTHMALHRSQLNASKKGHLS
jgi:hypothetical protein